MEIRPMAAVETDQDLLFGILALQSSLIEQPDLIAAFQCWSKERSRSLARILVERGALTEDDRSMLNSLVRRHLEKRERRPGATRPPPRPRGFSMTASAAVRARIASGKNPCPTFRFATTAIPPLSPI